MSERSAAWLDLKAVEAWISTKCIFHDLTLRLNKGQHTAVLGPNGSGKSTLVRLIDRSLHPVVKQGSSLHLFGSERPRQWELRRQIGLVSAELEQRVPPQICCRDLVLSAFFGSIGLRVDQIPTARQSARVDHLLPELELNTLAHEPFGHLSDGQKRRVLIARALAHQPDVLVLDEPTNALDLKAKHDLLRVLRRLCCSGTTLVMITHQVETLIPEIERVICLKQGTVIADGDRNSILSGPQLSALFDIPLQVIESAGYRQVMPLS